VKSTGYEIIILCSLWHKQAKEEEKEQEVEVGVVEGLATEKNNV
jgi:hypothetical protein